MPSVRTELSERVDAVDLVAWMLIAGATIAVTGDLAAVLGIAIAFVAVEVLDVGRAVPTVDERWVKAGLGVGIAIVGAVWTWLRLGATPGLLTAAPPTATVLAGCWLVLDARADFVERRRFDAPAEDPAIDEMDGGDAMRLIQEAGMVARELRDDPMSVPELAAACDLTESRVREAIELASHDGTVYPVDDTADEPEYAVDETKLGVGGFGRQAVGGVRGLWQRLLRPLVVRKE